MLICIAAVGRHAPMPPKIRVAACLTGCHRVCAIGCRGRRPRRPAGVRQAGVHGCFVGSGLDRSVPVYGNRAALGQMLPVLQP